MIEWSSKRETMWFEGVKWAHSFNNTKKALYMLDKLLVLSTIKQDFARGASEFVAQQKIGWRQ